MPQLPRLRFDFRDADGQVVTRLYQKPRHVIEAHDLRAVIPAMREVERALADGYHVAGFVGYEAAPAFDGALTTRLADGQPLLWFGVFDSFTVTPAELDDERPTSTAGAALPSRVWIAGVSEIAHTDDVDAVRAAIAAGDVYQVNLTFPLHAAAPHRDATLEADLNHDAYGELVADQRPGYGAYLDLGRWRLLSLSPELFFDLDGPRLRMRPMKGTALRGRWIEEDDERAEFLRASPKERAENVMIVDLVRNDISRIAETGSVQATSLFDVERYPTVLQMTSTVEGRVRAGIGLTEVFTALFPSGSVTGAPKSSAMRLIAHLERSARGPYCGAIGFAEPGGRAVFNVAIRTCVIDTVESRATFGIGGGITWDSSPAAEYSEALSKAACLVRRPPFELIETFRLEGGQYVRLAGHLRRMQASAQFFDFAYEPSAVMAALDALRGAYPAARRRVRLRLDRCGRVAVDSGPLDLAALEPTPTRGSSLQALVLADTPVSSSDVYLFHKTSRRETYESHTRAHPQALDVLLWNERSELTEFTVGNLVVEMAGRRFTPARACGLLTGVLRDQLVEAGVLDACVLRVDDLSRADRMWRINSLRGWIEFEPPGPVGVTSITGSARPITDRA